MRVERNSKTYLSKSLVMKGLQCHKALYLHKFHPELKDEVSEAQQARFESGYEVGAYAWKLFPGGIEIPYEGLSHGEQLELTRTEIERGAAILYEPAFSYDNVFVKADILRKARRGWELYEVKGSNSLKEQHLDDVAVQYYVLEGAGLHITRAFVVHLNNEYVRNGEIDPSELFVIEDVTKAVREKQCFIADEIVNMRKAIGNGVPNIDIGKHCEDPYDCDFTGHCWKDIPADSVFKLGRRGTSPFDLYRQGIVRLADVPPEALARRQRMQLEAYLGKTEHFETEAVKEFLNSLWYPLCFLDFETFMVAIPPYDGTWPYQQIPYQYSLHVLGRPKAKLRHYEFLAEPGTDPRKGLARKLMSEIPENACVLAYNAGFEVRTLNELAGQLPEYAEQIKAIVNNTRDLMLPFSRRDVSHWQMNGSHSQKAVLPVLCPELSYEEMEIGNGNMAMSAYFKMCQCQDPTELEGIRKALLEYCKLDTLGMVKILERLRILAGS